MNSLTKMVEIPLPAKGNVTLVISDGTGYISVEVTRASLLGDIGVLPEALNYLDAELIAVDRPNERLRQSFDDVIKFRQSREDNG